MKANEAPEKLYLHPTAKGNVGASWLTFPVTNEDIEYIRTDAFIEKAVSWLKEHREHVETEDNGIMGWIPDYFIEDFKNYMKE